MEGTCFRERTQRTPNQGHPPTWSHITISWRKTVLMGPSHLLGFCYCLILETLWSLTCMREMRGLAVTETPCAKRETQEEDGRSKVGDPTLL